MNQQEINQLVDFMLKYSTYLDSEKIKEYIEGHLKYGTCDYALDKDDEIMFVCRWNIEGEIAYVLDFVLNPKYRNKGMRIFKWVLLRNLPKFPYVRFLKWRREHRDNRTRLYNIKEILKLQEVI